MKNKKVIFILFAVLCLVVKIYFIVINNPVLQITNDDWRNYTIAQNYVEGKGYGIYDDMAHRYRLSAFHTSSTIFLYQFLIKHRVSEKTIVFVFFVLSTILYLLAVLYLYRIVNLLDISRKLAFLTTAMFAFYPLVLNGMGSAFHFDNLVLPLLVINFYFLLQWVKNRRLTLPVSIFLIGSITFSCFTRAQVLPLYFFTGCFLLFLYLKDRSKTKHADNSILYFLIALPLSVGLAYIPALVKNKKMFGAYIISTQTGFELLQGNNGMNNGNWQIPVSGDTLDKYVHERIPEVESLDEYSESKARGRLAINWIKEHPGKAILNICKKVTRYFVPWNAPAHIRFGFKYNPLTCLVHLIFLTTIIVCLVKNRKFLFSAEMILLLIPVAAAILLVIIFFFNFKMRYYGDPLMIIIYGYGVEIYLNYKYSSA
jgi:hypothetical protein